MLTIERQIETNLQYPFSIDHLENLVFFDIETTGFSADVSSVYLIGAVYYKSSSFYSIQWFADDYDSEKDLLINFFHFLKDFQLIIHFNGTTFDMPYLLKKCKQYLLDFDFSHLCSIDIYKLLLPYKRYFPTNSLKLKAIERFLGIHRDDIYDGGQLIHLYGDFLRATFRHDPQKEELLQILLLHNFEDISILLESSSILFYIDWFKRKPILEKIERIEETLIFHLKHPLYGEFPFLHTKETSPVIIAKKDNIVFQGNQSIGTLEVPIHCGELKYFYNDYKDYFYLPKEDTAIHKSVAIYVDKEFREKAKKSNCYTRHSGEFIWQPNTQLSPALKKDYKDKNYFHPIHKDVIDNHECMEHYVQLVLESF